MSTRGASDRAPAVSAIICTRNRPDKIGTAVRTVLANEHDDFTLTVIDQSTDDETRSIVEAIAESDPRLRYVPMDEVGLSRAYNRGIAESAGPILAFTDDDCVVPTDWITSIEAAFRSEPDGELLYGQVIALESEAEKGLTPQLLFDGPGRLAKGEGFRVTGMGANFAARRRLFESIGGFDEVLGGGGPLKSSQDYDLAYRAYCAGKVILTRHDVLIRHDGRREHDDWPTLMTNYGFGDGAFYTKHVRCRDPYALRLFATQAARNAGRQLFRVVRRRPMSLAYLRGMATGARSSFAYPVDRESRMYADGITGELVEEKVA
ncbi:MAG: glycosyltransferase family A protein [Actinomycetota bacterium]